jgi:hypothetical protein
MYLSAKNFNCADILGQNSKKFSEEITQISSENLAEIQF